MPFTWGQFLFLVLISSGGVFVYNKLAVEPISPSLSLLWGAVVGVLFSMYAIINGQWD